MGVIGADRRAVKMHSDGTDPLSPLWSLWGWHIALEFSVPGEGNADA